MSPEEIVHALETESRIYPKAAMEAAMQHREAVTPLFLSELKEAVASPDEYLERDYDALVFIVVLLGWFKEERAHPLLIELASLPGEMPFFLLGDMVTEDLKTILWQTSGDDVSALQTLIEDKDANEFCRSAAMEAMLYGVVEGKLEREAVLNYLAGLFTGDEADEPDSYFWSAAAHSMYSLYPDEHMETITKAFEDDLIDPSSIRLSDFERVLQEGEEATLVRLRRRYQQDLSQTPHDRMSWWASFQQPTPAKRSRRATDQRSRNQAKRKRKKASGKKKRKRR